MRAIVKHNLEPRKIQLKEVENPNIGRRDVLIRVRATSICGTDVHIYESDPVIRGRIKPGLVVGHEFCGTVEDIGKDVNEVSIGDLVTAEGHISCGTCFYCRTGQSHICPETKGLGIDRPGVFAEYVSIPAENVVQIHGMPLTIGAIQDPFGNAVHTAMATNLTGCSVLITGCGPIGLMAIGISRISGARMIFATDTSDYRLELARKMGADVVLNPLVDEPEYTVLEKAGDLGVDVLLEMSGNESAIDQGFNLLRQGGCAVLLGLPGAPIKFDLANHIVFKAVTVRGIYGRLMFKTWYQNRNLLNSNHTNHILDLSPIITHLGLLEDFEEGMELMRECRCGKVVLFHSIEDLQQGSQECPTGDLLSKAHAALHDRRQAKE